MTAALVAEQTGFVFAGPVGSLDAYIDRVSQIPVLSKEDEVALAIASGRRPIWMRRGNWCSRTCASSCTLRAATWATACRWATWCRRATSA